MDHVQGRFWERKVINLTPKVTESLQTNLEASPPFYHITAPRTQKRGSCPDPASRGVCDEWWYPVGFLPKLSSGSRSPSGAVSARSLPAGRANKLPARPGSATAVPGTQAPAPEEKHSLLSHRPFFSPGSRGSSAAPKSGMGMGRGNSCCVSPSALWLPGLQNNHVFPSRDLNIRLQASSVPDLWPLTLHHPSAYLGRFAKLLEPLCPKLRGSSKVPAGPGRAFATHRTPASNGHARFTLVCVGVPGGPRNHSSQPPGARWSVGSRWTRTSERPAPFLREWLQESLLRKSTWLKSIGGYSWNLAIALLRDISSTGLAGTFKEEAGV